MQSRVDFRKYRHEQFMNVERLQPWLDPHIKTVKHIRLYNYGETFMHHRAIDFCLFVKERSPATGIDIATNGMLLNTHEKRRKLVAAGVDHISFSIHGSTQEAVQKYMTKKFKFMDILEILKDMMAIKKELGVKKPILHWKYLLFEWNDSDEEINRARSLSNEIGLDGILFSLVGYPSPSKRFTQNSKEWDQLNNGIY